MKSFYSWKQSRELHLDCFASKFFRSFARLRCSFVHLESQLLPLLLLRHLAHKLLVLPLLLLTLKRLVHKRFSSPMYEDFSLCISPNFSQICLLMLPKIEGKNNGKLINLLLQNRKYFLISYSVFVRANFHIPTLMRFVIFWCITAL